MDPEEVLSEYAVAWARGDAEAAFGWYATDVVMRLPGRGRQAGVHAGMECVVGAINALLERTGDGTAVVETIDRLASGERVALVLREVVTRGDERLELRRVNLYRVRGDRIVEIDVYEADQCEVDAFFG